VEEVSQQVGYFENGFPWMALEKSATVGDGIVRFSEVELADFVGLFEQERSALSILKMVPASGAATRMFKSLFEHLTSGESNKESRLFFEKIQEVMVKRRFCRTYWLRQDWNMEYCPKVYWNFMPMNRVRERLLKST
jgi:hypothetical protein